MPYWLTILVVLIESFLLGSIPSGVLVSRIAYKKDVRDYGSGNIGTTNSFRALGKVGGCIVFLMDFAKGFVASGIAWALCEWLIQNDPTNMGNIGAYQVIMAVSLLGAASGHIYSPWLHFKGGKGIATSIGCLFFVFGFWPSILEIAIFAILVALTKKVSAGSIASALACPFISAYVFWGNKLAWLICTCVAVMILYAHRQNIERLRNHTESGITASNHAHKSRTDGDQHEDAS